MPITVPEQFAITTQFTAQLSMHIVDPTVYAQILADFYPTTEDLVAQGLVPVGLSPETLRHKYGLNWVDNPTSADFQNLPPIGTVFSWTGSTASRILGHPAVGNADGVQVQTGVSYVDPNGQLFTEVTWEWSGDLQFFTVGGAGSVTWDQQVITYAGDGATGRLIPTSFSLATASNICVWVHPHSTNSPCFRANSFSGSYGATTGKDLVGGVMSFQAGGFTVTDSANSKVNTLGQTFTALVMRSGGTAPVITFGEYAGNSAVSTSGTAVAGTNKVIGCGTTFSGSDIGRSTTLVGATLGTVTTTIVGVGPNANDIHVGITLPASEGVTVTLPGGGIAISTFRDVTPNMIVVFGLSGTGALWTENMPVGQAVSLGNTLRSLTDQITSVGPGGTFSIGADNTVSNTGINYGWCAWHVPVAGAVRALITTYKSAGTGSIKSFTGLGFTPGYVYGRVFDPSLADAYWKSTQAAVSSTQWGGFADNLGVRSLDADGATLGTSLSVTATDTHGFALKGSGSASELPPAMYPTSPVCIPNGDGTSSCVDGPTTGPIPPDDGPVPQVPPGSTPTHWCNPTLGESVFQIDSPGPGWVVCSGPATANGWYLSGDGFGGNSIIVSGGRPADPRPWSAISGWSTIFGGSPQAACILENALIYAASGYTVGTDAPPVRYFDGKSDRALLTIPPPTAGGAVVKAVLSVLPANGTVYATTWDAGTSSSDWSGRVIHIDQTTGNATILGTAFAAGEMPYALAWHMGRLWCGTNNDIGTVGKIYFFRPGIDTTWTLDHSVSVESAGAVASLVSFRGLLYVGTVNAAGSRGKILVRAVDGTYSVSDTASGGTATLNNGFLQLTVFNDILYTSYWNEDTPKVSKIRKFNGSTWSDSFGDPGATIIRPYIVLPVENNELYAIGGRGGTGTTSQIVVTANGLSWTDLTSELPETDKTLLPMFGAVVV